MGGADGKTPNAMEGILSMILANMASSNGSIINISKNPPSPLTNETINVSTNNPEIATQEDSISAKKPEI